MASSIKLYTTGNMEAAHLHNNPAEVSGYPAENALDNNLDTIWKASDGQDKDYQVDLGEAKTVDCAIMFVKNYSTIAGTWTVYYSDDGSAWSSGTSQTIVNTSTPIRLMTLTSSSHRYWRTDGYTTGTEWQIAGIWFGRLFTISQGNEYPEEDVDRFYNNVVNLPGGRLGVAGINRNSSRIIGRNYQISGSTNFNNFVDAFNDSAGRRYPLVLNEGSSESDAFMVRFVSDDFNRRQIDYLFYEIGIQFEQIPYIDEGNLY